MDTQQTPNSYSNSNSTREFFDSNSLVAQVAFLLLVLFGFIILLRLGISLIGILLGQSDKIKLIDGMVDATQVIVIPQEPSQQDSKTIYRSENESEGIEFTWSCWIYIENISYKEGQYRNIFYKGNDYMANPETKNMYGLNFPNNCPGLYLAPNSNSLVVIMNTFNVINEEITIDDIPLNKWVNVIIRCENTTLDVYINGTVTKSHMLHGVPKQNYGNVYVAMNGGFSGYISNLYYYSYALGTTEINKIQKQGPNTHMIGSDSFELKKSDYLSLRWFFYGSEHGYTP